MNRKLIIVCFIIGLICLVISMKLLYNMGIFADEYGLSFEIIFGGDFWLYMVWVRLLLMAILCALLFINFIIK